VCCQKQTTVFLLQAGDKRLIVNIGPHQGNSEVADAFKRGQFDLLPNGFQEGLLTILGKAPASSGNLECSLVTLVDLASAELKAARQIRTEDGEIVWARGLHIKKCTCVGHEFLHFIADIADGTIPW
jgi:hypothetical protein